MSCKARWLTNLPKKAWRHDSKARELATMNPEEAALLERLIPYWWPLRQALNARARESRSTRR